MDIIPQNTPHKQCSKCEQWKDATLAFFYRDKQSSDGLRTVCKACAYKPKKKVAPDGYKWCKKCDTFWFATSEFFYADNREPDGFRSPCKRCVSDYECTDARIVQKKSYKHQYYVERSEEIKQNTHAHYLLHKDLYITVYPGRYRKRHRERVLLQGRLNSHRYQSRQQRVQGTHTAAQIAEQLRRQHYKCYYAKCGFSKFPKVNGRYVYHIEHTFPISRVVGTDIPANDMSYLVLSCKHCNTSKGSKFPWEWSEGGRLL